MLQAEVVVHDELRGHLADIAEVPGLIPAGYGDLGAGVAEDEAVLRAVVLEPGEEVLVHLGGVHLAVILVGDVHGEAGLVVAGAGGRHELGSLGVVLRVRVVRPADLAGLAVIVVLLRGIRAVGRHDVRGVARGPRGVEEVLQRAHGALVEVLGAVLYRHDLRGVFAYVVLAVREEIFPGVYVHVRLGILRAVGVLRGGVYIYIGVRARLGFLRSLEHARVHDDVVRVEPAHLAGARRDDDDEEYRQHHEGERQQNMPGLHAASPPLFGVDDRWGMCRVYLEL